MAVKKKIEDVQAASEAVAEMLPETVKLRNGDVVQVGRFNFLCWRSLWEEIGTSFAALFAGGGESKLADFPMAMAKLAAYSTLAGEFTPEAAGARLDEMLAADPLDVLKLSRVAFRLNYTAEDVAELTGFFGDLGSALQLVLPSASNSSLPGAPSPSEKPPNRATRRRQDKLGSA